MKMLCRSAGLFTMDVIGAAVFGIDLDCRNDPDNTFAVMGRRYFDINLSSFPLLVQGRKLLMNRSYFDAIYM